MMKRRAPYARVPVNAAGGPQLLTTSAERYDIIMAPSAPGVHTLTYEFRHWLTGTLAGTAQAHVIVT